MIKKFASFLFGLSAVSQPLSAAVGEGAPAGSDRWVAYERVASDGKPLVIVARTGNAEARNLLQNGRATVVICQADPANVNVKGMPSGTDRLYAIEDRIDSDPALLSAAAIRIGSVTGQGQRRMFIVHRDALDLSPLLQTVQVNGFSCNAAAVDDRQALIRLVTPSHLESQMNGDQEVIATLQASGDDGTASRKAEFWFYGRQPSLKALAAYLKAHEFSLDHWLDGRAGIVLSRSMPVDFATFHELTPIIVDAAEQFGVDYDGWGAPVASQGAAQPVRKLH